ncbi:MAG: hypothetical protein Q7S57_01280 [bacterium]|nr:hypothetical protein [bacterium]
METGSSTGCASCSTTAHFFGKEWGHGRLSLDGPWKNPSQRSGDQSPPFIAFFAPGQSDYGGFHFGRLEKESREMYN